MRALLAVLLLVGWIQAEMRLPVFMADNHAESFGWVSRTLDLNENYLLVLCDAHSDATAVERSDEVREQLRRVVSEEERAARVEAWRVGGRVQAYNWIEPLIPRPFGRVTWVSPEGDFKEQQRQAGRQCDGRLEVEPRSAGHFAERWSVIGLEEMEAMKPGLQPVIWSLDLDFFAGMQPELAAELFDRMWVTAMDWPGLSGVSVAISRPWLTDDEEADRLISLVLDAVSRTRGARLEWDVSLDDRPDDSQKAAEGAVVRWDLKKSSLEVRARLGALAERCEVRDRKRRYERLDLPAMIEVDGAVMDLDGVWRLDPEKDHVLRVRSAHGMGKTRWFELKPARHAYDLFPESGLAKGFIESGGRWVYEKKHRLALTHDGSFLWPASPEFRGRVRMVAEYEKDGIWLPAGEIEIQLSSEGGFVGALMEQMHRPYVFGIAEVRDGHFSGVESGWGADCSNLLVHAWRRCGVKMEWGDPGRLRRQLKRVERRVSDESILKGVMVDFGHHVAAVVEDLAPIGVVGEEDRVVHHLGGFPEVTTLGDLQEGRPPFKLWCLPNRKGTRIKIAGDVVPVGKYSVIGGFERGGADLFLVNLEAVPTEHPVTGDPAYDFRFSPAKLEWLKARGVDAVSLANNHAGDAGVAGLEEALSHLQRKGIGVMGAGRNAEEACRPWVQEGVACFGVSLVPALVAREMAGVASLPEHGELLAAEMQSAIRRGERVVVLVHAGDEYRREVNEEQRFWARWLIDKGADLIAGSGPHLVQREERFGGTVIAHSLGNAVFPDELKGADDGRVGEWCVPPAEECRMPTDQ